MKSQIYTTTEILRALDVPYYVLEYMIRTGKIKPIPEGRGPGRERRFTKSEFEKAKELARFTQSKGRLPVADENGS